MRDLKTEQLQLEKQYHPKMKREILEAELLPLYEGNYPIWVSAYSIVSKHVPDYIEDVQDQNQFMYETTMNLLVTLVSLRGQNTPIQSIVFVKGKDKIDSAIMSMSIMIDIANETNLANIKTGTTYEGEDSVTVYPKVNTSPAVNAKIDQLYSGLPMLCKPVPWTSNYGGGYLTDSCKSHIILGGKLKHHNKRVNYEPVNYLQEVGFRVNKTFFNSVEDDREEAWVAVKGKQSKNKTGYVRNRNIIQFYLDADTPFYFVQKVDNRLRSYSTGYNLNPQGYEWQKAVLCFSDEKELDDDGIKWTEIYIAGKAGFDKETFWFRQEWYEENVSNLVHLAVVRKDVTVCTMHADFITLVADIADKDKLDGDPYMFESAVISLIEAHI